MTDTTPTDKQELIEPVNQLLEALHKLKTSAENGGLPDMHMENILKWYVETAKAQKQQWQIEALRSAKSELMSYIRAQHGDVTADEAAYYILGIAARIEAQLNNPQEKEGI